MSGLPPPGWYWDAAGDWRRWDGTEWTQDVTTARRRKPIGSVKIAFALLTAAILAIAALDGLIALWVWLVPTPG